MTSWHFFQQFSELKSQRTRQQLGSPFVHLKVVSKHKCKVSCALSTPRLGIKAWYAMFIYVNIDFIVQLPDLIVYMSGAVGMCKLKM